MLLFLIEFHHNLSSHYLIFYLYYLKSIFPIMATLDQIRDLLKEEISPVLQRLDVVEVNTKLMEANLKLMEANLKGIKDSQKVMESSFKMLRSVQLNSMVARHEKLHKVPNNEGMYPLLDYPESLNQLLVAGNERLPGTGMNNSWNKRKSLELLRFYGAEDGYDSETDNEFSLTARASRLKLARVIGISSMQIQQAAAALVDI